MIVEIRNLRGALWKCDGLLFNRPPYSVIRHASLSFLFYLFDYVLVVALDLQLARFEFLSEFYGEDTCSLRRISVLRLGPHKFWS